MKRLLLAGLAALALISASPADARCHTKSCHVRVHKKQTIRPHIPWLHTTGQCESGGYSLHSGLRAYSNAGPYYGRYQFDMRSWYGAGGHGDPRDAGWLEQAYRAVRWRQLAGVGAWPVCG